MLACASREITQDIIKTASKRKLFLFLAPINWCYSQNFQEEKAMFVVAPNFSVSLSNLKSLHASGHTVVRSAHVGNQYLSNLLLLEAGIPALWFDRNTFQKDVNYHPGAIIQSGKLTSLGHAQGLVSLAEKVAQVHIDPVHSRLGALCETETQYFFHRLPTVEKVFALMQRHMPHVFNRYVCACGIVHKLLLRGNAYACECTHCGHATVEANTLADSALALLRSMYSVQQGRETTLRTGVLWSLPFQLILETLLTVNDSGKQDVYQLSGPDMVNYTRNRTWLEEVRWVWGVFEKHGPAFGLSVPADIRVHIVPTAELRFGYIQGHEPSRLVVEGFLGLERTKTDRTSPQRAEYRAQVEENITEWNILYDIHNPPTWPCSQHDLLPSHPQLVIPEEIVNLPMQAVSRLYADSINRTKKK